MARMASSTAASTSTDGSKGAEATLEPDTEEEGALGVLVRGSGVDEREEAAAAEILRFRSAMPLMEIAPLLCGLMLLTGLGSAHMCELTLVLQEELGCEDGAVDVGRLGRIAPPPFIMLTLRR